MYLQKPLQATLIITKQMNRSLAQTSNVVITSMQNPITLFVHNKGFSIPLKELNLRNARLSHGMIDFGQITCQNTGNASDVGDIFKMEIERTNQISLWFAPMDFMISRGMMQVDRTEILYNRAYQIALWGDVDFNRRYVDMILGLTAQSLQVALGIRDLARDYVLQVPVEGPFGNVQINKGAATTKIALLLARKKLVTPESGIWGSVLGAIGELTDDQSSVPQAKPPFPWGNLINFREDSPHTLKKDKLSKKKAKALYKEFLENLPKN